MKTTLLFLSVFLSASLFGQSKYLDCESIEGITINSKNDIPTNYTGPTKYCTKQIMILRNYQNGKLNGLCVKTHLKNRTIEFSNYVNGEKEGEQRIEDLNGNLIERYNIKNGKTDGEYFRFNKGSMVEMGNYIDGLKNGNWYTTTYSSCDSVLFNYRNDTVLSYVSYNKGIKIEELYSKGLNVVYQSEWYQNGKQKSILTNQAYKKYSENEALIFERNFDTLNNALLREREWTKLGVLVYDNNISDGYYKTYYKSGGLRLFLDFNSNTKQVFWNVSKSKEKQMNSSLSQDGSFFYDQHNNVDRTNIMYYNGYAYNIGPHKFYSKNGSKISEVLFSGSGRTISYSKFDKRGGIKKVDKNNTIYLVQSLQYDSLRKLFYSINDSLLVNGMAYTLYNNGNLKDEFYLTNGKKDGVYRTWYKNGQLKLTGILKNGKVHGIRKNWYEKWAITV